MFRLWILGSILGCVLAQTNLLQNEDFESTNYHGNWYCMSCDFSPNTDAYHGTHSVHVSNRQQNWQGAAQNVNIQGNEIYRASAYVKLWNTHNNQPYQTVSYMLNCKDGTGKNKYVQFGQTTRVQPGQWYEVGGAIQVMNGAHDCHIYIQTEAPTDYLLDKASLIHIPHDTNWKTHANQRINANRKADITVSLAGSGVDASTVQIEEMKDTAIKYKKAGIPVGGIGVQGHLHMFNVELIKARLDILAEAGLPIMVTEFGVNEPDENKKAGYLTDLLTMFFSHPSVKGVLFWGFWDQTIWEHDAPLYNGPNLTPNAAGRAYENLFHNTWRTHTTHTLHGSQPYHVRGFKGDYTLTVTHGHDTLKTETFTLTDGGKNIQIHLNGTHGGSPSVSHVIVG